MFFLQHTNSRAPRLGPRAFSVGSVVSFGVNCVCQHQLRERTFRSSSTNGCYADKPDLGFIPFAGAALRCACGGLLAALQSMSPKRSLLTGSEHLIQTLTRVGTKSHLHSFEPFSMWPRWTGLPPEYHPVAADIRNGQQHTLVIMLRNHSILPDLQCPTIAQLREISGRPEKRLIRRLPVLTRGFHETFEKGPGKTAGD